MSIIGIRTESVMIRYDSGFTVLYLEDTLHSNLIPMTLTSATWTLKRGREVDGRKRTKTHVCKENYESLTVRCGLEKVKQDWEEVCIKHACI